MILLASLSEHYLNPILGKLKDLGLWKKHILMVAYYFLLIYCYFKRIHAYLLFFQELDEKLNILMYVC